MIALKSTMLQGAGFFLRRLVLFASLPLDPWPFLTLTTLWPLVQTRSCPILHNWPAGMRRHNQCFTEEARTISSPCLVCDPRSIPGSQNSDAASFLPHQVPARPWATEADYTAGSSSLDGKTSPGWDCVYKVLRPPQVLCWDCVYKVSTSWRGTACEWAAW